MATRNHSRGTRLSGRSGGNRPRTHPPPKPRRKPAPKTPPKVGAADAAPYRVNGVAATALRGIRKDIELILSHVIVVEHALLEQNVELDDDAALVLRAHVGDPLQGEIEAIGRLLGEDEEVDENDGGAV